MPTVYTQNLVVLVLIAVCATSASSLAQDATDSSEAIPQASSAVELARAFRRAAAKVNPSVVAIETYSGPRETSEWSRKVAGIAPGDVDEGSESSGPTGARDGVATGIILDSRGYVMTCNHVVAGVDSAFVRLADGRRFKVTKTLQDPFTDVAVLKIDADVPLAIAELSKEKVSVGDWVVTIGNPYGLGVSASAGIVSATDRHLGDYPQVGLIQTDAATNPGNSGGALVNLEGNVVGMTQGGYGTSEGFQGIGFVIPIDVARKIAVELIESGRVLRPYLGFQAESLPPDIADYLRFKGTGGMIICDITPHSPAALAGVQLGDVLTHLDNSPVRDPDQFLRRIAEVSPGTPISLTLVRKARSVVIQLAPGVFNSTLVAPEVADRVHGDSTDFFDEQLGLTVAAFTPETARELGYPGIDDGLLITRIEPRSIASGEGICAGMSVLNIDGTAIRSIEDYRAMTQNRDLRRGTLLRIGTARQKRYVLCQE